MSRSFRIFAVVTLASTAPIACTGKLDAGSDLSHGLLPVDERNPIVISNDDPTGNWFGEYAMLLAQGGHASVAGIIVNSSAYWPDINANMAGWTSMAQAALASGMRGIPDPLASPNLPLRRPADGNIDTTVPNGSAGARFIIETSRRLAIPYRPLVVATGGSLTDVADAYLVDPTVAERIVVVSALGRDAIDPTVLNGPNGFLDPWANTIVVQRLQYVQVNAFSDQSVLVPAARLAELPANAFGTWVAGKQSQIYGVVGGDEQVSVIAAMLPSFVLAVERMSQSGTVATVYGDVPALSLDPNGRVSVVTSADAVLATSRFWQLLLAPSTYGR